MSREAMKQPESLRLADALDDEFLQGRISNHSGREAAAELRRLHERCEQWRDIHDAVVADSDKVYALLRRKREWVGLTLNEAEDLYEKYTDRAELINAVDKFLEEKNA